MKAGAKQSNRTKLDRLRRRFGVKLIRLFYLGVDMKVRQLIAELKNMPPGLEVYTNANDNSEWEIAGYVSSVVRLNKEALRKEYDLDNMLGLEDRRQFAENPKEWVIIHS